MSPDSGRLERGQGDAQRKLKLVADSHREDPAKKLLDVTEGKPVRTALYSFARVQPKGCPSQLAKEPIHDAANHGFPAASGVTNEVPGGLVVPAELDRFRACVVEEDATADDVAQDVARLVRFQHPGDTKTVSQHRTK